MMNPDPAQSAASHSSIAARSVPELLPSPVTPLPAPRASPRTIRWVELGLLLAVSFGSTLYQSVCTFVFGTPLYQTANYNWPFALVHELTALALCAYLLHKQGRSFRQIGLTANWSDFAYGIGLMFLQMLPIAAVAYALRYIGYNSPADHAVHAAAVRRVLGPELVGGMLLFQVVNAFYEELIVRAYLMTDLSFLTGSTALAVVVSCVFQGSYHIYQGWQAAVAITAALLIYSLFYAYFKRVTPIIIAHMLWDLWTYVGYHLRHHY